MGCQPTAEPLFCGGIASLELSCFWEGRYLPWKVSRFRIILVDFAAARSRLLRRRGPYRMGTRMLMDWRWIAMGLLRKGMKTASTPGCKALWLLIPAIRSQAGHLPGATTFL